MKTKAEKIIDHCAKSFLAIKAQEETELRKLCQRPELYDVAQALADAFLGNLTYLCNFISLANGNGGVTDVQEVIDRLEVDTQKTFKTLTGRDYLPKVCRRLS